jgi:hypothetical protein
MIQQQAEGVPNWLYNATYLVRDKYIFPGRLRAASLP